ncbi:hypothetical protein ACSVC9_08005 [Clostridium sp. LBM24168]
MKKFYIAVLSLCFVALFATTSFAASANEIEPNNSYNQAQLIQRNNENPAEIVNGNYQGQYVAIGSLSDSTDEDWYKVYLPADSKTILGINSSKLSNVGYFDIYDQNLNHITNVNHVQDPSYFGPTPYRINIPTAGYYYIKVHSDLIGGDYRFYIGGPDYSVDNYTYNAASALTLTPTINSAQASYDLTNVSSIPDDAIVYNLALGGTRTNHATDEERSIKIAGDSSWILTPDYTFTTDVPVLNNKLLKNVWTFKLDGNVSKYTGTYKLLPEITFHYVYPVLPH